MAQTLICVNEKAGRRMSDSPPAFQVVIVSFERSDRVSVVYPSVVLELDRPDGYVRMVGSRAVSAWVISMVGGVGRRTGPDFLRAVLKRFLPSHATLYGAFTALRVRWPEA